MKSNSRDTVLNWLLEGDVSIRWNTLRALRLLDWWDRVREGI